jgi:hypothetical protein
MQLKGRFFIRNLLTSKTRVWPHPLLAKVAQTPWTVFLFFVVS